MTQELYNDGKYRIVRETVSLPDGRTKTVARMYRCDASHILAFPKPGRVLVLREFRPFYGNWLWMLPSGHVDKETDPLEAAQRELREETGYRAKNLRFWCTTQNSEQIVIQNHYYLASDLVKDPLKQDDDEMIEVHDLGIEEALKNVQDSSHVHTPSAYALLRFMHERPEVN